MKRGDYKYCKETKKYCYSSEAKATRALNRYEDITRVYYCKHCDSWHSTSMDEEKSRELEFLKEVKEEVSTHVINKRLNYLKKKLGL